MASIGAICSFDKSESAFRKSGLEHLREMPHVQQTQIYKLKGSWFLDFC